MPKTLRARRAGKCQVCPEPVLKGQLIVAMRQAGAAHYHCWQTQGMTVRKATPEDLQRLAELKARRGRISD